MKIEKNSALLVIDAQNKYNMHIKMDNGKSINNIEKIIKTFNKKNKPVYFTQWSRCKKKFNCTRKHKRETVQNKIAYYYKKKRTYKNYSLYNSEKTKKWKCPSYKCDIVDKLKPYSNKNNTYVSDMMDSLAGSKKLLKDIKKNNIKILYITGGWAEHCVPSTAFACINRYEIFPYIVSDAIFGDKRHKKVINILGDTVLPLCETKDIVN